MATPCRSPAPHVLIVEDEEAIRTCVSTYLDDHALSSVAVGTLADARAQLEQDHFDVVVLDLGLRGEDGFELLRELAVTRTTPVIVASGGDESARVARLGLDVWDYMAKPYRLTELTARIEMIVQRQAATPLP